MKQGMRFLVQPGTFFNQLQWSRNHWLIVFTFLFISAIETHVGQGAALFASYSNFIANQFGLSYSIALWLMVSAKLLGMLAGAWLLSQIIWFAGTLVGQYSSRRVLVRRLAVVFTVVLAAFTASHLELQFPSLSQSIRIVSLFLYVWGGLLGYLAIKEQFHLTFAETIVVGSLAILLIVSSWAGANHYLNDFAKNHMAGVAYHRSSQVKTH